MCLCQDHKLNHFNYIMAFVTSHRISWICICYLKWVVPKHGSSRANTWIICCCTFFSGLISRFFFDILQNPSGCLQIFSGYIVLTCNPPAMGLEPSYCDWAFHGFPQSLHVAPGTVSSYKQWLPAAKFSFMNPSSLTILIQHYANSKFEPVWT